MNKEYFFAIGQIIRTGHWITDQVNTALKGFDISEPQYNVLRVLNVRGGKPITVQQIQTKMVQRTSNVTRIIDKLLDKGLVERHECPTNRRKMDITITKNGEDLLVELDKKVQAFHAPMSNNLTAEEAKTLTELIIKLKAENRH